MRYTPAVTIVAAWMSADTGVGPSMASGNQGCSGNWPDLPVAPSRSSSPIASVTPLERCPTPLKTSAKLTEPRVANMRKMAIEKPASPTRFIRNAFLPAVAALGRRYQNAMSR